MAQWIEDPQGRPEVEKVTKELKLPVWKANHKGKFREFWNEVWEKIEDYILKLKGDTEKNSKGLNDRLVSAVGKHDGDFPITNAVVGNVYYSELTKKYYKCKVGGPAPMPNGNFIDLSILENLNRLENLFTNTVELAIKITKSTNIPELKNYKFWFIEISISIHLDRISHQKYTFTTSSAIDFFYNDNFHTLGKYAIQINRNGEVILKGEAVDKGYVKVTIYGIY
nr:MAG TPA: hypothetical protein [Caudoviricetes sp.]